MFDNTLISWVSDALVLLSMIIMSIAIYGMFKLPDVYTRIHAAGKGAFLGILPLLLAASINGGPALGYRAFLIAVFLLLTTPVGAHVIGLAAYRMRERMETPGAIDESGSRLNEPEHNVS
ncbi:MAG: monovalent cation/H(+) antiporter subunit G [Chloroflexi bacterium AL-N5]|nr:monovalent cation/H(+) antiporter subunit G [Chloroflexi bacterium AL-N5]